MPEDDPPMRSAVGVGRETVFPRLLAIHFGAHVERDADPLENRHDHHQHPECRGNERRDDHDDIEERDRYEDLNDALAEKVEPSAEITLKTADNRADHLADQRQEQREENRYAKSVKQSRRYITAPGIRAKIMSAAK